MRTIENDWEERPWSLYISDESRVPNGSLDSLFLVWILELLVGGGGVAYEIPVSN